MQTDEFLFITGRGLSVTGTIKKGTIRLNDKVKGAGLQASKSYIVTGISLINSTNAVSNVSEARADDKVSILLRGATKAEISGEKYLISVN